MKWVPQILRKAWRLIFNGCRPSLCRDIRSYAARKGWTCIQVRDSLYDEIGGLLENDEYSQHDFKAHEADYRKPQTLVRIPAARLRDRRGLLFLEKNLVSIENHWWAPLLTGSPTYTGRFRQKRTVQGDIFSLLGTWSDEYYHWFHDVLPRLDNCLAHLPDRTRFLIHQSPKDFQLISLEKMGILRESLEEQPDVGERIIEHLWWSSPVGHTTFGDGIAARRVADKIKSRIMRSRPGHSPKRIYISRMLASRRRVVNEEEIVPILERYGFTRMTFESLTYTEQVEIAAGAEMIIGPHGAGLTNLIYAPDGCTVGELAVEGVVPCYSFWCKQLGHTFSRLTVSREGKEDYRVAPEPFKQWLESLVSAPPDGGGADA